ncbi:MAG: hypothetical protein ACUVXB_14615 [Bryobacteraceae bacterium]
MCRSDLVLILLVAGALRSAAAVALLVGEPYGKFGFFNPTGHAAIYLLSAPKLRYGCGFAVRKNWEW